MISSFTVLLCELYELVMKTEFSIHIIHKYSPKRQCLIRIGLWMTLGLTLGPSQVEWLDPLWLAISTLKQGMLMHAWDAVLSGNIKYWIIIYQR